jgi:Zn-dependent metalloprotease
MMNRHKNSLLWMSGLSTAALVAVAVATGCSNDTSPVVVVWTDGGAPQPDASPEAAPPGATLEQLEADTGAVWAVIVDPPLSTPAFLRPKTPTNPILLPNGKPEDAALAFLVKYAAVFGIADPKTELSVEKVLTPKEGATVIFKQHVGPADVTNGYLKVEFEDQGGINSISEHFYPNLSQHGTVATIDPAKAVSIATADMTVRFPTGTLHAPPTPLLAIDADRPQAPLVYRFEISFDSNESLTGPVLSPTLQAGPELTTLAYVIDATTGAIIDARSLARDATVVDGSGAGVLGDTKHFSVLEVVNLGVSTYYLGQTSTVSRPPMIARPVGAPTYSSDNQNLWNTIPAGWAVDAYTYIGDSAEYWYSQGRQSYDGQNHALAIVLNDPAYVRNAAWLGNGDIAIGPPQGGFAPAAALDVMGHEFQHGVNQTLIGPFDNIEATSLDEGLADVFGNLIERNYQTGYNADPWLLGEGAFNPFVRSLKDPTLPGINPPGLRTAGGAIADSHYGAGIVDFSFYLITTGGTNPDNNRAVNGAPLGIDLAEGLYVAYMKSAAHSANQGFAQHARDLISKAQKLRYPDDLVTQVGCSFWATNVLTDQVLHDDFNIVCDNFDPCKAQNLVDQGTYCGSNVGASPARQQDLFQCIGGTTKATICKYTCVQYTNQSDVPVANCCMNAADCKPTAADFEGLTVAVPASNEYNAATMTLKNVASAGTIANWQGAHKNEAGALSKTIPQNAQCFSFLDNTALAGIPGFPDDKMTQNISNEYGQSNLVAVWQDNKGKYQWSWILSGDSYKNTGGNQSWREYQFNYDGTKAPGTRSLFQVYEGVGGFSSFQFLRQQSVVPTVTRKKSKYFDLPDSIAQ